MERQKEIVCDLSNSAIFNELEWALTEFQDHAIIWRWIFQKCYEIEAPEYKQGRAVLNGIILNDFTLSDFVKYSVKLHARPLCDSWASCVTNFVANIILDTNNSPDIPSYVHHSDQLVDDTAQRHNNHLAFDSIFKFVVRLPVSLEGDQYSQPFNGRIKTAEHLPISTVIGTLVGDGWAVQLVQRRGP